MSEGTTAGQKQPSNCDEVTMMERKKMEKGRKKLVVATRLHLGNASVPPSREKIQSILDNFYKLSLSIQQDIHTMVSHVHPIIAVDATPKIENYNYIDDIQTQLNDMKMKKKVTYEEKKDDITNPYCMLHDISILPVSPWGKFVPALNALVSHGADNPSIKADWILFVSAEVNAPSSSIKKLCMALDGNGDDDDDDEDQEILVAGGALNGHLYGGGEENDEIIATNDDDENDKEKKTKMTKRNKNMVVKLNGRTIPWNTLAMWNLHYLKQTGFSLVSDMIDNNIAGVEECVTIALQQKLFSSMSTTSSDNHHHHRYRRVAKLVNLNDDDDDTNDNEGSTSTNSDRRDGDRRDGGGGVHWEQNFATTYSDPKRQEWHEKKMKSKIERSMKQLQILNLYDFPAIVIHC